MSKKMYIAQPKKEAVNHPQHYGGGDNPYEVIKIIEHFELGFNLGNAIKYILRAGKKDDINQDLKKAVWYLQRELTSGNCKVKRTDNTWIKDIITAYSLSDNLSKAVRLILETKVYSIFSVTYYIYRTENIKKAIELILETIKS